MRMGTTILLFSFMILTVFGRTDDNDAQALRDIYRALDKPSRLKDWKIDGGDPCAELWAGVSCFEASVIHIDLHGLELTGDLGSKISNLQSLKQLDLSSNQLWGEIPDKLPLNITHLKLASNNLNFSKSIPNSLSLLKHLERLNISNNALTGVLGDLFGGRENLRVMDLSFNNFTGDLPISFGTLKALARL